MSRAPLSALDPALERRPWLLALVACAVGGVGVWLRFHDLGGQSLWFDEILQARITRKPLVWILWHMPLDKPPLDYWIQHLFIRWVGESEVGLRLGAAIWASLTLAVAFLWARSALGPTAALAALGLLALSPLHLHFAHEGRPYSLFLLLITLSSWSLWELSERVERRARWWALHAVATLAAVWTLYLALLTMLLQQAWIWARWLRERRARTPLWRTAVGSLAISLLSTASLLPLFTRISTAVSAEFDLGFEHLDGNSLLAYLNAFVFGQSARQQPSGTFLVALPVLVAGVVWGLRRGRAVMSLLLTLAVGTFAGALAFYAAIGHWFEVRYALAALVPLLMVEAVGVTALLELCAWILAPQRKQDEVRTRAVGAMLGVALVLSVFWATPYLIENPYYKIDWRGLAGWLKTEAEPGDRVLLAHPWHEIRLDYYLEHLGTTVDTEVHTDHAALVQRAEDLGDCYVMLTWDTDPSPLDLWLWGYPMPPLHARGIWLWRVFDPEAWLRAHPDAVAAAAERFARDGFRLQVGDEAIPALGMGWGAPERFEGRFPFRWTARRVADLCLPLSSPQDLWLVWRAEAFVWPGAPPQHTTVRVNGTVAGAGVVPPRWSTCAVHCPSSLWLPGINIVEFETDHCVAPCTVTSSPDHRTLGMAVEWLELRPGDDPREGIDNVFAQSHFSDRSDSDQHVQLAGSAPKP